jgi:hypothetical protein
MTIMASFSFSCFEIRDTARASGILMVTDNIGNDTRQQHRLLVLVGAFLFIVSQHTRVT